jgi:FixJ family two-component response regulator
VKAQHSASPAGEAKPLVTREEAAKKLSVSGSSIDRARERRHESVAERATAAAKLANLKEGRPRRNETTPIGVVNVTVKEAAKKLGVGSSSVDRARAVLAKGTPEVIEQMSKGELAHLVTLRAFAWT